jgi:hypothetical protein
MALNKIMQNVKGNQYNFDALKNAYDTDVNLKSLIKNFDRDGITLRTDLTKNNTAPIKPKKNSVDRLAQQAVNKRSK